MADTGMRAQARRLLRQAAKLSGLFIVVSVLFIALAAFVFQNQSFMQVISFAVFGAFLQTAFLGLIYEVWLRGEVEDATFEKLRIQRDIRDHGLIQLAAETQISWDGLLRSSRTLCIVTSDPKKLLGPFDDLIFRQSKGGHPRKVVIAVPGKAWADARVWLDRYIDRWRTAELRAEIFAVKLENANPYEFIGTDDDYIVVLPKIDEAADIESAKILHFQKSEKWGIGAWLDRQVVHISRMKPTIGYSVEALSTVRSGSRPPSASLEEPEEMS